MPEYFTTPNLYVVQPAAWYKGSMDNVKKTILVVDDQATTRLLLRQYLENDGYAVLEAQSGESAIALLQEAGCAGILLDLKMQGIDGIETCRRLRQLRQHKMTPILIVTMLDEQTALSDAFAAGCDDFIVKPINPVVLRARLQGHIQRTELYFKLEQVRKNLNRYISPRTQKVVELYSGSGRYPSPEKLDVCVLFTDIRDFTQLAQRIEPEYLFKLLSEHLAYQVELVYEYQGYVDKYAGDGIMAVFEGANSTLRGYECALAIIQHATELAEEGETNSFAVGCGLHRGAVVIGNIGSPEHFDYSVVGETVNLAARLCGHAAPLSVVMSEVVQDEISAHGKLENVTKKMIKVKGVEQAICVYEVKQ